MSVLKLLVLPGDGIGPEVTQSALEVLDVVAKRGNLTVETERADFGGA
ncbi:MAG: isocitrate/isopropylmalate family dehydrogenase, partial [Myxococcota bacterium]|nr:isocitrate/isopropylmalate family dehydrogenase [Myxococcota bacterium]